MNGFLWTEVHFELHLGIIYLSSLINCLQSYLSFLNVRNSCMFQVPERILDAPDIVNDYYLVSFPKLSYKS